ncbi:hypothetical protein VWM73_11285, partial [Campylobacter coli]
EHKKGVPSKLNKDLFYRRIDAAIVSSIESARKKYKNLDLGICVKLKIESLFSKSVALIKASTDKKELEATFNDLEQLIASSVDK